MGHTNSQLPTLIFNYNLKWPTVICNVWAFSTTYLDENSRRGKYNEITNVNQGKYYKINVGHTKFQPMWISHPH